MTEMFAGKTALVTGAGSGIGEAVAVALAEQGANVVVADINREHADGVVGRIAALGRNAVAVAIDVTKPEDMESAVRVALEEFGGLHLAFNNAGIGGPSGLVAEIDVDAYRRVIDTNLNSVFYGMRAEIPAIINSGGGAIVNTSSILGLVGDASAVGYTAAKHGVTGLTRSAALGYADKGVRVNSVHPGYITTPLIEQIDPDYLIAKHPMGRLGTVGEVAAVVLFLLSDQASFVTGSQYGVDGGYIAQ